MSEHSRQPAAAPRPSAVTRSSGGRLARREWLWALLFLGPNLFLFLSFTLFPMIFGFGVSFFRWTIVEPPVFVGLENYERFFLSDPLAAKVVKAGLEHARAKTPPLVEPEPFLQDGVRFVAYPGDPRHSRPKRAFPGPTRLAFRDGRFEPPDGFDTLFDRAPGYFDDA